MANSLLSGALAGFLGLFGFGGPAKKPPTKVLTLPPVSAPVVASASGAVRGTMVMIHGGAWRGPDAGFQRDLVQRPGALAVQRGWRVVSVDYKAGKDGLQDVLDAIGQELLLPSGRLLCIYGESAGGHLALVAAARLPAVDCVIAAGTPTDFQSYLARAHAGGDSLIQYVADTIRKVFGDTPEALAPWEPVQIARDIDADVLLLNQVGDLIISPDQVTRFRALRPTTQAVDLEAGDTAKGDEQWVHGALSSNGRSRFDSKVASFTDRAVASHRVARSASATGCRDANRRIARSGPQRFGRALRCLARSERRAGSRAAAAKGPATTRTRMRGEVTPARAWAALRRTRAGRAQLAALAAGRAQSSVRSGDPSVLVVRRRPLSDRP